MTYTKKTNKKQGEKTNKKQGEKERWGVLWRNKGKESGTIYFSGTTDDGISIKMFTNRKTKEAHPDYRIFKETDEDLEEIAAMWVKTSKNGVKFLTGKTVEGVKLVAFATKPEDREKFKCPYFNIYLSEDTDTPKAGTKKTEDEFVNAPSEDEDFTFN